MDKTCELCFTQGVGVNDDQTAIKSGADVNCADDNSKNSTNDVNWVTTNVFTF